MSNNNLSDVEFLIDEDQDQEAHGMCDDEMIVNTLLEHVLTGANHQMQAAIELTKLIVGKDQNAEQVFKTYREALKTVSEASPIPSLLNMMGAELA